MGGATAFSFLSPQTIGSNQTFVCLMNRAIVAGLRCLVKVANAMRMGIAVDAHLKMG
jgi:hypothetical protein